jgi:hypothetical protein
MNKVFSLKYNLRKNEEIVLDKEINEIKGEHLYKLGLHIDPKNFQAIYFTISKCPSFLKDEEIIQNLLPWELTNCNKDNKALYISNFPKQNTNIFSENDGDKENSSRQFCLKKGEKCEIKNLKEAKMYFNSLNSSWDFLYFSEVEFENNYMRNSNLFRITELRKSKIIEDSDDKKDTKNSRNDTFGEENSNDSDLPIELGGDEIDQLLTNMEEEKSIKTSSILKQSKSSKPINSNFSVKTDFTIDTELKIIISANIYASPSKNHQIIGMNSFYNQNHQNSNFTSNKFPPSHRKKLKINEEYKSIISKKKIINDDEEEENDEFLSESILKEIIGKYNDENKEINININCSNNNLPSSQHKQMSKEREEYFKSISKLGDFNSNNKRLSSTRKSLIEEFSNIKTKRLKKATDNKELQLPLNTNCIICLDTIRSLANLNNCNHDFCKSCITEWSKKTNVCPLCKKEFKKIIYYDEKGKRREINVKKKKLEIEMDEEDLNLLLEETSDQCMICGSDDDYPNLLVCDGCRYNVCHTYCDNLELIPEGDWFCRDCRERQIRNTLLRQVVTGIDMGREIISDDEDDSYEPRVIDDQEEEEALNELLSGLNEDEINDIYEEFRTHNRQSRRTNSRRNNSRNNRRRNINVNINVSLNMNTNNYPQRGRRRNNSRS